MLVRLGGNCLCTLIGSIFWNGGIDDPIGLGFFLTSAPSLHNNTSCSKITIEKAVICELGALVLDLSMSHMDLF